MRWCSLGESVGVGVWLGEELGTLRETGWVGVRESLEGEDVPPGEQGSLERHASLELRAAPARP